VTFEERFGGIEHVIAARDEERRKEREEDRQLWRDTQRQINETNAAIAAFTLKTDDAIARTNAAIDRTNAAIRDETERAKAAEDELRTRIASLVSAMGEFFSRIPTK